MSWPVCPDPFCCPQDHLSEPETRAAIEAKAREIGRAFAVASEQRVMVAIFGPPSSLEEGAARVDLSAQGRRRADDRPLA